MTLICGSVWEERGKLGSGGGGFSPVDWVFTLYQCNHIETLDYPQYLAIHAYETSSIGCPYEVSFPSIVHDGKCLPF